MKLHLIHSVMLLKRLPPTLRQNRFSFRCSKEAMQYWILYSITGI